MENVRAYSLRRIKQEIPRQILESTFISQNMFGMNNQHITLDSAIASTVLDGQVYLDIQLLTGDETSIDISGLDQVQMGDGGVSIYIPPARTMGRDILQIYRLEFSDRSDTYRHNYGNSYSNNNVDMALDSLIEASGNMPITSTTECRIVAPRTIYANVYGLAPVFTRAQVCLSVDKQMAHIPPKAFTTFGDLCVAKCKEYIYNEQVINLDQGRIERGMEVGRFREIIDEYRDATQTYKDLLVLWRRKAIHMNHDKKAKFIKLITPKLMF